MYKTHRNITQTYTYIYKWIYYIYIPVHDCTLSHNSAYVNIQYVIALLVISTRGRSRRIKIYILTHLARSKQMRRCRSACVCVCVLAPCVVYHIHFSARARKTQICGKFADLYCSPAKAKKTHSLNRKVILSCFTFGIYITEYVYIYYIW